MNFFKTFFGNQKNLIEMMKNNKEDIRKANKRMLGWLLILGLLSFLLLFVMTFIADDYGVMKIPYGFIIVLLIVIIFVNRYAKVSSLLLIYGSYVMLMGIATYASAFLIDDSLSVWAFMILFQIPIVILDRNRNIHALELAFLLLYIVVMICFKDKEHMLDECVNVIMASIMGTILGAHLRYAQIENFNFKRIAVIQENIDALTGLSNRRRLFDVLEEKNPSIVAIMMIDIDEFKLYNDSFGHQAGDKCLKKVSVCIASLHKNIEFFRYGGEEFIGVAYNLEESEIIGLAEKCVKSIENLQIEHGHSKGKVVTISMGLYIVEGMQSNDDMIYYADTALYNAKHNGKSQVQIFKK
ncbi:GGDEF domain-containing protein [Amedibacillus sp. YH-ame6]